MKQQRRNRISVLFGTLLATLLLAIAVPNAAYAAACSGYGCDGHDPNVQTWQAGPVTNYERQLGGSVFLELRWGQTDGDQYGWARVTYVGIAPDYRIEIERCNKAGTSCEIYLGVTKAGASAWTAQTGPNSYVTRTPMYYNPSTMKERACVIVSSGATTCTPYY
ncbi:hypothetical protein [Streptomyces liangshanensis]|uniref:Secreted protein n=1 Tax=Streptomyces liangshanensis TaxID=2717324 RepID=A0A6G9GV43_9ACTN|nr:hypothetical protein [Streptomyces liangshanensis]QIQ02128.1 hypothetical protein HA039_07285 [Streptomyces liangshanensis]